MEEYREHRFCFDFLFFRFFIRTFALIIINNVRKMKNIFIVVTFILGVTLAAMMLTKPEAKEHYDAVVGLTQNVVNEEAKDLEKLAESVDLSEVAQLGKDLAMNTAGFYLQSHLKVEDYTFVTIGMLNYDGMNIPVTLGILGKVYRLVDEDQVRRFIRE